MTIRGRPRPASEPGPNPDAADSDAELFFSAVSDAKPLGDRDRVPRPRPPPRARGGAPTAKAHATLSLVRDGENAWAKAPGVSERQLAELRAGRLEPEAELDLHGYRAAEAGDRTEAFIAASAVAARRCVLVISGRGLRSGGATPVKDEVLDRLTEGTAARHVRAISTAKPQHGGPGALYVALKRR